MKINDAVLQLFSKPKYSKEHPNYIPHPYRRPGPGQNCKSPLIDLDIKLRVFNFACKTLNSFDQVEWPSLQALAVSDSGSQGVIFAEFEKGGIVVKGTQNVGQNTYMHYLCEVLGLPVPQRRIVKWDQSEFKSLTKELQRATFFNKELHDRVRGRLDRPFLEIYEYIPGITLLGIGPKRAQKILNFYDPKSRDRMIKMGMLLSFDVFINNSERFPLSVWNNNGNVEHTLIRTEPAFTDTTQSLRDPDNMDLEYELIYALDHRPFYLEEYESNRAKMLLNQYYSSVEEFLNQLFVEMKSIMHAQLDPLYETKEQKIESIEVLKRHIYDHTLYELKEMAQLQILLGFVICADNLAFMGQHRIEELLDSVYLTEDEDYKGFWNSSLKKLSLSFYGCIISIYKKFCSIHKDVVQWAKDVTLNQYSFDEAKYQEVLMRNPRIRKQKMEEQERIMKEKELQLMEEIIKVEEVKQSEEDFEKSIVMEDDDLLNKKIKDIFDLDIPALKNQIENEQKLEQQKQAEQLQKSMQQSKVSGNPQQKPQINQKGTGGILANQKK